MTVKGKRRDERIQDPPEQSPGREAGLLTAESGQQRVEAMENNVVAGSFGGDLNLNKMGCRPARNRKLSTRSFPGGIGRGGTGSAKAQYVYVMLIGSLVFHHELGVE